jgi:hypothetical protein
MASSGTFEFDEHGRSSFRPAVPSFPRLEDVNDLLEDASVPLPELTGCCSSGDTSAVSAVYSRVLSISEDARRDRLFHATAVLDIFDRFRANPAPTSQ